MSMDRHLSNERWNKLGLNRFDLVHKLTKIAVDQVEKGKRYDCELNEFLDSMQDEILNGGRGK